MTARATRMTISASTAAGIRRRLGQVVAVLILQAALLFLTAGTARWFGAWLFLAVTFGVLVINGAILLRRSPETIAERGRPSGMATWDLWISGAWALVFYVLLPIAAGLDIRAHAGQPLGLTWNVVAAIALLAGLSFAGWAMAVNAYFSTVVRIQSERGHTVCTAGPYRWMRHPGYVGFIAQTLATPLTLGSQWAVAPAMLAVALMVVRTAFEDRVLRAGLTGYEEYTQRVRYRLVPGLW
jgi:protein-S-isoprenylcysteine O-methyltransferase Ste14